jgi:hypothetical protein
MECCLLKNLRTGSNRIAGKVARSCPQGALKDGFFPETLHPVFLLLIHHFDGNIRAIDSH